MSRVMVRVAALVAFFTTRSRADVLLLRCFFPLTLLLTHEPKLEDLGLRIYDVGVDANDYRPVSIEQIAAFLSLPRVRDSE